MRQIIYAWNYREWGGAQIYFMSLMKEAKRSYAVTALIPADSEPKILQYLKALGIPVEFLPPALSSKYRKGLLGKLTKRLAILRAENAIVANVLSRPNLMDTIVHVDLGFWQSSLSLFRLCMKTNVFTTVHTGLTSYTGWRKLRWKFKGQMLSIFARFHILTSNYEARESLKSYIPSNKFPQIEVTYSGIDPDEIENVTKDLPAKTVIRQKYGLPENKPILITVGQFIERKGCWVLMDALKRLRETGKDFVFAWLSTTLPNAETMEKIETYGLGGSFRLIDAEEIGETRKDLLTLESSADVFVLASLQEGLPIALIEAMALGLPCIATNVNAIPEGIMDCQNGRLVQPNDPVALREAITDILDNQQQRKILGDAAKRTAFAKFNSQVTAERTLKLYDDVWQTQA